MKKANQLKLGEVLENGTGAILLAKREDFYNSLLLMVLCLVPSKKEYVTWGMNEDGITYDGRYFFNISEAALDFDKR